MQLQTRTRLLLVFLILIVVLLVLIGGVHFTLSHASIANEEATPCASGFVRSVSGGPCLAIGESCTPPSQEGEAGATFLMNASGECVSDDWSRMYNTDGGGSGENQGGGDGTNNEGEGGKDDPSIKPPDDGADRCVRPSATGECPSTLAVDPESGCCIIAPSDIPTVTDMLVDFARMAVTEIAISVAVLDVLPWVVKRMGKSLAKWGSKEVAKAALKNTVKVVAKQMARKAAAMAGKLIVRMIAYATTGPAGIVLAALDILGLVVDIIDVAGYTTHMSTQDLINVRNVLDMDMQRNVLADEQEYPMLFPVSLAFPSVFEKAWVDMWSVFAERAITATTEDPAHKDRFVEYATEVALAAISGLPDPNFPEDLIQPVSDHMTRIQRENYEERDRELLRAMHKHMSSSSRKYVTLYPHMSGPDRVGVGLSEVAADEWNRTHRDEWTTKKLIPGRSMPEEYIFPLYAMFTDTYRELNIHNPGSAEQPNVIERRMDAPAAILTNYGVMMGMCELSRKAMFFNTGFHVSTEINPYTLGVRFDPDTGVCKLSRDYCERMGLRYVRSDDSVRGLANCESHDGQGFSETLFGTHITRGGIRLVTSFRDFFKSGDPQGFIDLAREGLIHFVNVGRLFKKWLQIGKKRPDDQYVLCGKAPFVLMHKPSGMCVDANNGNTPHLWDCDPNNPNQVWSYEAGMSMSESTPRQSPGGRLLVTAIQSDKQCLEIVDNDRPSSLRMNKCKDGTYHQVWANWTNGCDYMPMKDIPREGEEWEPVKRVETRYPIGNIYESSNPRFCIGTKDNQAPKKGVELRTVSCSDALEIEPLQLQDCGKNFHIRLKGTTLCIGLDMFQSLVLVDCNLLTPDETQIWLTDERGRVVSKAFWGTEQMDKCMDVRTRSNGIHVARLMPCDHNEQLFHISDACTMRVPSGGGKIEWKRDRNMCIGTLQARREKGAHVCLVPKSDAPDWEILHRATFEFA